MSAIEMVVGGLLGLGTQLYSNTLHKLPYMRHPWEHLLGMGLGAVFVNQLIKWDEKLKEDLDKAKAANKCRYFGGFVGLGKGFSFDDKEADIIFKVVMALKNEKAALIAG